MQERIEKPGEVVGYQIRLESKMSERTRLMFCTTGILLRRLEGKPDLNNVTHVIVDEVHERSEESDFLLMILRDTLKRRPDLRVVLMSATVNADLFSSYFNNCPVLEIPGRTFPVQQVKYQNDVYKTVNKKLTISSRFSWKRFWKISLMPWKREARMQDARRKVQAKLTNLRSKEIAGRLYL